jgi:hypothetical protein
VLVVRVCWCVVRVEPWFCPYSNTNSGHKVSHHEDYKRNVEERSAYVAPCNIECYKCHNYGHMAIDCRSMIDNSMKEKINIRYKKVCIKKHEEHVNKG